MKLKGLSLAAVFAIGGFCGLNAADTLAQSLANGKFTGVVKATYSDHTDERYAYNNENIFGLGLELGYVTDSFYGFRIGLTGQGWWSPNVDENSKMMNNKEWYANGAVLSEAYLGYAIGNTDIKFGRQYLATPLVAGNPTRAFKEAFEGLTIVNKDLPDTTLTGGWYYKFQGRSKVAMTAKNTPASASMTSSGAPSFKDRVIVPGAGPVAMKFDNIYTLVLSNQSISGLKLTAAWAQIEDLEFNNVATDNGNVNIYLAEANYKHDLGALKLGFDAMYKASRTSSGFDSKNFEGDMLGFRVGFYEFYGFGGSYAYTTVSDDDALIFGVGNGPGSYTLLPIRGPFVFTGFAGMDMHKLTLDYNFASIGVNGLKTSLQYVRGDQDAPSVRAGSTAAGTHMDVEGWAAIMSYAVPQVKGLTASATYVALERDTGSSKTDDNELWLQLAYKFDLLK